MVQSQFGQESQGAHGQQAVHPEAAHHSLAARRPEAAHLDPFYVLAPSPTADEHARVLKQGDTFAVLDHYGDIKPIGLGEEGLYHDGTRFLSRFLLLLGPDRPLFLSSTVKEDNALLAVDLTNPDVRSGERVLISRGSLHLHRASFLWQGHWYQRFQIRNYGLEPIEAPLSIRFAADFADVFEVRGTRRQARGRFLDAVVGSGTVELGYRGLDGVVRRIRLAFVPEPIELSASEARFRPALQPQEEVVYEVTMSCLIEPAPAAAAAWPSYDAALEQAAGVLHQARSRACEIYTSNEQFNEWVNRSASDIDMMVTETPHGPYPYAGVPWFSTPFGRDGIITALEYLWVDPEIARGVLRYLAATQASCVVPEQDAEPGKILHETRGGEMAALGEVPFGRYYGSVDATPLFVMLAGAYYQRTGDRELIEQLWPNVQSALDWIDNYGDADGDGFVEYARRSSTGLAQQGWKDSHDSVFHADGKAADGPIALCEVQGYAFAARQSAAALAALLGHADQAEHLAQQARQLRQRFDEHFWCDELSTYALALDGGKRACRVKTSNAFHALMTGIAEPRRARTLAETLDGSGLFSGWGLRTLADGQPRYNPMSYHNGSVWPHDNALAAAGLAQYGHKQSTLAIFSGLFDASMFVDLHRMPELFCGFPRRPGEGPTLYPVACAPQSWAAASVFMLLAACLGIEIDAPRRQLRLSYPLLPGWLNEVRISRLRVGDASVDLVLRRHGRDVGTNVLNRSGPVDIVIIK
ncbi:MAG: amylo-alpha-1,6-glucosidase [Pirellulales bacterium]